MKSCGGRIRVPGEDEVDLSKVLSAAPSGAWRSAGTFPGPWETWLQAVQVFDTWVGALGPADMRPPIVLTEALRPERLAAEPVADTRARQAE